MATIQNFEFSEAETWAITPTFYDAAGDYLDVDGATIQWRVYNKHGTVLEANLTNGMIAIVNGNTGLGSITIVQSDHANVAPNTYYHECRIVCANSYTSVQFAGILSVTDSPFA